MRLSSATDVSHTLDESRLTRRVVVTPGMCSGGSLIFGRIGDWTWEAVSAACRTNVYRAHNADGQPAYLSFYYFHVHSGRAVHPHGLTFGDELDVTSRVFDLGTQSVVTLHRLAPAAVGLTDETLEPEEFYRDRHPDCLYVENYNRWISRRAPGSNEGLVEATPPGFAHRHLPRIPAAWSPRTTAGRAREDGSFYARHEGDLAPVGDAVVTSYGLDPVRDLNGVGLVYFASYFSIIDTALHRLWRSVGRSDAEFLRRRVVDQKIGYFGNADIDTTFAIRIQRLRSTRQPHREIADVSVRDARTDRLIAVAGIDILLEEQ